MKSTQFLFVFLMIIFLGSCSQPTKESKEEEKNLPSYVIDSIKRDVKEEVKKIKEEIEDFKFQLDQKILALEEKAQELEGETKAELKAQIKQLQTYQNEFLEKANEAGDTITTELKQLRQQINAEIRQMEEQSKS